jgi:hypothetical protein
MEAKRVLMFNGMMIIAESNERYTSIKETIREMNLTVLQEEYSPEKRWFYIFVLNN